ncbi:hypothetical protein ACFXPA_44145 [Amycolatopsis sp. NPDC059090]|uniref:hypothetical protein n=1 Tax=unclassified Amycolatopsis TaxID=2618356 RepID=UPI00366AFC0D
MKLSPARIVENLRAEPTVKAARVYLDALRLDHEALAAVAAAAGITGAERQTTRGLQALVAKKTAGARGRR